MNGEIERDSGVAVSLGASFLGYSAHAGFMAGLEESGVRPRHIAGASSGAIVGGLLAAGLPHEDVRRLLVDSKLKAKWFEWASFFRFLPMLANLPGCTGLMSGKKILVRMRELLRGQKIEESDLCLSIAVANLTAGRVEWKQEGDLAGWIIASCSVPGIIRHQQIDGQCYLDGGLADPNPCVRWAANEEIQTVLLHRVRTPEDWKKGWWNMSRSIAQVHEMITVELLEAHLEILRQAGKRVVLMDTHMRRPSFWQRQITTERFWELGRETGLAAGAALRKADIGAERNTPCAKGSA